MAFRVRLYTPTDPVNVLAVEHVDAMVMHVKDGQSQVFGTLDDQEHNVRELHVDLGGAGGFGAVLVDRSAETPADDLR